MFLLIIWQLSDTCRIFVGSKEGGQGSWQWQIRCTHSPDFTHLVQLKTHAGISRYLLDVTLPTIVFKSRNFVEFCNIHKISQKITMWFASYFNTYVVASKMQNRAGLCINRMNSFWDIHIFSYFWATFTNFFGLILESVYWLPNHREMKFQTPTFNTFEVRPM